MALPISKLQQGLVTNEGTSIGNLHCTGNKFVKSSKHSKLHRASRIVDIGQLSDGHQLKLKSPKQAFWYICSKPKSFVLPRGLSVLCQSTGTQNTETRECSGNKAGCSDSSRTHGFHEDNEPMVVPGRAVRSSQGIATYVSNDAKYVNERARNDIVLLSRGIMRLDERARQDVAIIGSGFLKLDARARKDTRKIDRGVKKKAERLHHIASMLKEIAESRLKKAADKHWSDGALEADLRRADFFAKQRAARDAFMALEFIKNIHDMMVTEMYKLKTETLSVDGLVENIMIEKNGKTLDFFPGEMSPDRITAVQEVYWSMASALSEADGIDYTDPEELELLVATLIDLDAMDGKSSVSLLVECSSSPDDNTRKALANALAAAPSMWTLGNAGMGALQRLAEDSNPAIAAAASKTIYELKKQWEIEEGDIWRFTTNQTLDEDGDSDEEAQ